jgi:alpha-1,3-rhamnosyl/mannosyltransferase
MDKDKQEIKVLIGSTSLIKPLTGIGNYTFNLCKALTSKDNIKLEYFYGAQAKKSNELQVVDGTHANKLKKYIRRFIPYAYKVRRFLEQNRFKAAGLEKIDVYHEPNFIPLDFNGPTVITVHDLSYLRYPEVHPKERVQMMNELMPVSLDKADCIIADSYFTKEEIISEFNVDDDKVHVTHLGKAPEYFPRDDSEIDRVTSKFGISPGKYTLAVGTIEPRKNLIQAIRAYQVMPQQTAMLYPLVIVGMRGWKEDSVFSELLGLVEEKKAVILGYVDFEDLPILYSGARALVFPSLYEGFGLPVLEAMACGTPVVASNTSSIPEVVGEAGILIEVGDIQTMQKCIEDLCVNNRSYKKYSQLGLKQAENFTWEKCAQKTYEAYLYAIEKHQP